MGTGGGGLEGWRGDGRRARPLRERDDEASAAAQLCPVLASGLGREGHGRAPPEAEVTGGRRRPGD